MQRPVHPSYGRVKQNVDGCLFVWTGILMYHGLQYVGLLRVLFMSCYCHINFIILFYCEGRAHVQRQATF